MRVYAYICIYIYVYVYACIYIYVQVCVYVYVYVYVYVCVYIYIYMCNQSEHDTYLKPTSCASFGPPASLRWRRHRTRLKLKETTCSADGTDSTHGFRELRMENRLTVCQRIFPGDFPENILDICSFTFGSNMLKVCIALATRNEEEPPGFGSFRGPDKTRTRPPPGEKTKAQGDQKPRALECSLRLKSPSPQPDFVRLPWHKPRPGSQVPPKKKMKQSTKRLAQRVLSETTKRRNVGNP